MLTRQHLNALIATKFLEAALLMTRGFLVLVTLVGPAVSQQTQILRIAAQDGGPAMFPAQIKKCANRALKFSWVLGIVLMSNTLFAGILGCVPMVKFMCVKNMPAKHL
jgi:hypothetical protein